MIVDIEHREAFVDYLINGEQNTHHRGRSNDGVIGTWNSWVRHDLGNLNCYHYGLRIKAHEAYTEYFLPLYLKSFEPSEEFKQQVLIISI